VCGRFLQLSSRDELARLLDLDPAEVPELFPRYNVAPTQPVATARLADDGRRSFAELRWGLIPSWARDAKIAHSLINARAETVAEKPAFRAAFKARRCLVPATGFYEWAATGGKHKQPYHFRMKDGRPFALAGLWERWHGEDEAVETCAILTTEANAVVRPVHDRMPVVVAPGDFAAWLDPRTPSVDLHGLLRPYAEAEMTSVPVGRYVNSPRNEGPQCLAPAADAQVEDGEDLF
jgi:putative SOS response-associated peptidase YedK